jgi:hypothetical protein
MPLPKEKSTPKTELGQFTCLLYGSSKIGKSTFCSNFDNALFFATEPGLNCLSVFKTEISSWEGFLNDCKELALGKHNFKTVVIDTVDNLYKFCSDFMCKKLGISHESELGFGKGYSMVNSEFQRVLTRLSLLPIGLVMVSHSQEKEMDTRTGKVKKIVPTLTKGAREIVLGLVDLILYCDTEVIKDPDTGKPVGHRRVIRTKAHQYYDAGDRTGKLPDTIALDYNEFVKAFSKPNTEEE